jgi:hypothetical protein
VITHRAVLVAHDIVQHGDHLSDLDLDPALFAHLARGSIAHALAQIDGAPGQRPSPEARLSSPLHDQHAFSPAHSSADGDDRPLGIGPAQTSTP